MVHVRESGVSCLHLLVCWVSGRYLKTWHLANSFTSFFMSNAPIHIGRLIKAELDRQGRKAQWFADQLCFERTNVYNIFRRQSIDADLLLRISQILQYDFFALYSQQVFSVENPSTNN